MTEVLFWFFLVIGPMQPGTLAPGDFRPFDTRQACWEAHARLLAGKDADWLTHHLVTSCSPHPAVLVPKD